MARKDTVPIVNQEFVQIFVPERLTQLWDINWIRTRSSEAESDKENESKSRPRLLHPHVLRNCWNMTKHAPLPHSYSGPLSPGSP
jgi:hypothetical protein